MWRGSQSSPEPCPSTLHHLLLEGPAEEPRVQGLEALPKERKHRPPPGENRPCACPMDTRMFAAKETDAEWPKTTNVYAYSLPSSDTELFPRIHM